MKWSQSTNSNYTLKQDVGDFKIEVDTKAGKNVV